MLLGGHSLDEPEKFQAMLSQFWARFRLVRPSLDLYQKTFDKSFCIPIAVHGDEGRGKLRRPIMVEAWQPVISFKGTAFTNASGHHN